MAPESTSMILLNERVPLMERMTRRIRRSGDSLCEETDHQPSKGKVVPLLNRANRVPNYCFESTAAFEFR